MNTSNAPERVTADISPFDRARELEHERESECRVGLPYERQQF